MAQSELIQAIEQIGREKGIEREVIISALEEAYAAASRKVFKSRENIVSHFDPETGSFEVFAKKKVVPEVEDPEIEISLDEAIEIDPSADFDQELRFRREVPELGRIAAQAAKQVIYQKVKEAERERVYNEYIDRVGDLINGIVKRFERGDLIVDLGRTEGVIPRREQSRSEHYNPGDRVRAIIADVERSGKGPQVVLSRTDPRLIMRLFEMEVPEIYDGTVRIISTSRDAGERTKIGVQSRDRDVDPVGACVGMKGSRVQSVIRELRGEKIDIVQYHEDQMTFVREALKPATANRVTPKDPARREVEVIVADDQLSLAIGKRGQNVRLAGRLVGWKIDIKSESEKHVEVEAEVDSRRQAQEIFRRLELEEDVIEALIQAGFRSLDQLIDADLEDLTQVEGVDEDLCLSIHDKAEVIMVELENEEKEAARLAAEFAASRPAEEAVETHPLFAPSEPVSDDENTPDDASPNTSADAGAEQDPPEIDEPKGEEE